jgi:hypothetical protein
LLVHKAGVASSQKGLCFPLSCRYLTVDDSSKNDNTFNQKSEEVAKRKKEMKRIPKPYNGVGELIINDLRGCLKAVVSGAATLTTQVFNLLLHLIRLLLI